MKYLITAALLGLSIGVAQASPPYVFNLSLADEETRPTGERNLCGYSAKYNNGAIYIVVIQAPTTDKACPKEITWTEKGTHVSSGESCRYDMKNGTVAIAGYADKRSNSCWSESYVEWK